MKTKNIFSYCYIIVTVLCALTLLSGCSKEQLSKDKTHQIRYYVEADYELNRIDYFDENGMGQTVHNPGTTWSKTITVKEGTYLQFNPRTNASPQLATCKTATATIYNDGDIVATETKDNDCNATEVSILLTYTVD